MSLIDPGLVDELLELGGGGDLEVIADRTLDRGPGEVVHRQIALENLTVLGRKELGRSGGKRVRRFPTNARERETFKR